MDYHQFLELDHSTQFGVFAVFIACFSVIVFYVLTLRKTLLLIAPQNRFMRPNQVFLTLIPLFNLYWSFEVASRMANSLNNEFFDRKIAEEENPGRRIGISAAVLNVLSMMSFLPAGIILGFLFAYLYFFFYYWIRMAHFKNLLEEHNRFLKNK